MARYDYREAGAFAKNPRGPGGLVNVTLDARQQIKMIKKMTGESARMAAATKDAHEMLAKALSEDIATVLENKVAGRGRAQRQSESRLGAAIRSPENRRVNVSGYTVGYLDEIAAVRPYYRGLEEGSVKHVGRYLSGYFSTNGVESRGKGNRAILVAGGKDARFIQKRAYSLERPQYPGAKIGKRITGYNYFSGGLRNFKGRGGTSGLALAAYVKAFKGKNIDLLARALNTNGALPTVSGLNVDQGDQRQSPR